MFVMKRNQVIITALVVMIAVAGYLNYTDTKKGAVVNGSSLILNDEGELAALVPNSDTIDVSKNVEELTNTEVVDGDIGIALTNPTDVVEVSETVVEEAAIQTEEVDPGTAIFVNSTLDDTYFIQAKLVREQDRSKQKEILTEMINNKNLEQAQRAEFATQMLDIQKRIEKESSAEAMIEAKGFKEVYVRIDDKTVDVVVDKEVLTDAEIAQIEDIVKRKTGIETENIRISPMKKQ